MNQLSIEIPDKCLRSNDKLSQSILSAAALQLYQAGKISSQRAAKLAMLPHGRFIKQNDKGSEASKMSNPPVQMESLQGSRYLARVLWALNEGEKSSLTPMTASEIAKFVTIHSNAHTQETNTARFFRECRRSGRFEEYWIAKEDGPRRRYELSARGRKLIVGSQNSGNNET